MEVALELMLFPALPAVCPSGFHIQFCPGRVILPVGSVLKPSINLLISDLDENPPKIVEAERRKPHPSECHSSSSRAEHRLYVLQDITESCQWSMSSTFRTKSGTDTGQ